jgi:hypothetical protein
MPGTIKDDKSAIAQTSGVELQRHRAWPKPAIKPSILRSRISTEDRQAKYFVLPLRLRSGQAFRRRLNNFTDTHQFNRKLGIRGLAALLLVCLAVRVDAELVNLNCTYPTHVNCRDTSWFPDLDGLLSSMYTGSPNLSITNRHDGRNGYLKTGDYLDKLWYRYLDKGQYYYLDKVQYKLLGGANYILGHPCYPKLFERSSEQEVGFTNSCTIYIPWYDCSWYSCFKTGDNIEKWRYRYLDKGRYYALDEIQYTWLGGLAYEFETPCSGIWHTFGPLHSYDYHCLLNNLNEKDIIANKSSVPEPATIGLLSLGALAVLFLRNKRRP